MASKPRNRVQAKLPPLDDSDPLTWIAQLSGDQIVALKRDMSINVDRQVMVRSLASFCKGAWSIVEPGRELIWNWHLDVVCGYLEAVAEERIRRLIINIPPGSMKSLLVSVFFPAWRWTRDPELRFLVGSNEQSLALRDAMRMRLIVESQWFRERWGDVCQLAPEQREKSLFVNTARGHRESQGVSARITGKRGDVILWDDPHDTRTTESDIQRQSVLDAWDMAWSSRMNDPETSPAIIIMQRIHQKDITGHLLEKTEQGWVNLKIPMRYDPETAYNPGRDIGRQDLADPRNEPGELLFPQRYPEQVVRDLEMDLGAYGAAGQLQQIPAPKGGGELRREWILRYRSRPKRGNRVILVDPAGERKPGAGKRDNTAMGVFLVGEDGNFYLLDAYRDRLNLVERADILFRWHREFRPLAVGYERYGMQTDIAHLRDRMEREDYRFQITELAGTMAKQDRIRRLIPFLEAGRIWFPETLHRTTVDGKMVDLMDRFIEEEYLRFPVASRDDFLDMLSRLADPEMQPKLGAPRRSDAPFVVREFQPRDRGAGY